MAIITKQTIYLDLTPGKVFPVLHVSQGDTGLEALEFKLVQNSMVFNIPAAVTDIQLNGTTPLGVFSYNHASGVNWSGNTVTATVTETMTAEKGMVVAELVLLDSAMHSIGSLNFLLSVEPSPYTVAHVSTSDMASIIASLNAAQQNFLLSKSWAVGDTGLRDGEATNNSKYWSEQSSINGERWSVGKINGEDVPSTDETYENNSKYWASVAEDEKELAAQYGSGLKAQVDTNSARIAQEVRDRSAAVSSEASTRAAAISSLQSQIDQYVTPSTQQPDEVVNARVGADGTTYSTLGDAVRGQVTDLKNVITYNIDQIAESTQNIADVGTAKIGVAWNGNKNSARAIIEFPAEPNTTYTVSYGSENQLDAINVFEMQTKTDTSSALAHTISSSPTTFTTRSTAHVFVVQFNKADIAFNDIVSAQLQIEKGNIATDFVPALVPVDYYARKDIETIEGDLTDTDDHLSAITTETYNLADLFELRAGTAWNLNADADRATLFVPCEPGQSYTVSHDTNGDLSDIVYFELTAIGATNYLFSTSLSDKFEETHTTDASCYVIAIGFNKSNVTLDDVKAVNLQIVEGNAKRYIPAVSAIDQYVRNNMVTFVTPEMYGAFGDGVHDDTEYLQAALNSGKPVRAYGSYITSESLIIDSSARTGIDFEFRYINYTGTGYAIKLYGRNGRITGNCLNADNGHGIDIGSMGLVYQMNIDISLVRTPNGVCYRMGGSEPVSECVISGNRCVYGINAVSFVLDNYWVGQNTFMNMDFTTDKESAGYAFFANGAQYPLTGLTCYNISLEGSHGGFEFVNSMPGAPIETLNCFGLRTSEMSITDHYNVIRYTGFGVIRGKMFIDLANIENFDFSGATNNINMLTVEGRIKKGDRNFTKAYFRKGNYILEDMEDMPYAEGVYTPHATVDGDGNVIISYS